MAALVYVADPSNLDKPSPDYPSILFESSPEYWYLYRHFEAANLDRSTELIDLYGGTVIEGHQLHRLRCELENALVEVNQKPDTWNVLVGWLTEEKTVDTEDWREVQRYDVLRITHALLHLIQVASTTNKKLVSSGD